MIALSRAAIACVCGNADLMRTGDHVLCVTCGRIRGRVAPRKARSRKPVGTYQKRAAAIAQIPAELTRHAFHQWRTEGTFDVPLARTLFARSGDHCFYCKTPFRHRTPKIGGSFWNSLYHIEHRLPVCRGGTNDERNLVLACARCNRAKGTLTDEEFLRNQRQQAGAMIPQAVGHDARGEAPLHPDTQSDRPNTHSAETGAGSPPPRP